MQGIVEVLRTFDSEHNVNNTRREAGALSDLLECDVTIEYCDHYLRNLTSYEEYEKAVIKLVVSELLATFDSEHNVEDVRREAGRLSEILECDVTIEYCDHYLRNLTSYEEYEDAVINQVMS